MGVNWRVRDIGSYKKGLDEIKFKFIMNNKVTSNDQKGGITAGTVNFNEEPSKKEDKGLWRNPWFKYAIIPLAVLIIGGLIIYFLTNNNMSEQNFFDVTSNNQQGGITAGQVNIGKQDRELTLQLREQLEKVLPNDTSKPILISPTDQDAETLRFSDKIKDWLVSLGYANATRFQGIKIYARQDWPADVNVVPDKDGKVKEIIVTIQK